jgi:hypothetical protein
VPAPRSDSDRAAGQACQQNSSPSRSAWIRKATPTAAVVDSVGRYLRDREFPATAAGYRRLAAWASSFGQAQRIGVDGTGTYGAALTRVLQSRGLTDLPPGRLKKPPLQQREPCRQPMPERDCPVVRL